MLLFLVSHAFAEDTPPVDPNRRSTPIMCFVMGGIFSSEVGGLIFEPCLGYRIYHAQLAVHVEFQGGPNLFYETAADGTPFWNRRDYFGASLGAQWFPVERSIIGVGIGMTLEVQAVDRLGDALMRNESYAGLVFLPARDVIFEVNAGTTPQYRTLPLPFGCFYP